MLQGRLANMQDIAQSQTIDTQFAPETRRVIRGIRWTRLAIHIGVGLLVAGIIFPRISNARRAYFVQWWSQKTLRILNVILSIHGVRPDATVRNFMIAANHISWLDIYVINAAHPARFVAKAEIREWPIIGWLCEKAGTIFIRRTHRRDTARINDEMHNVLATGDTIGLFPEGTTTAGDRLLKFHSSLLEPAVANNATLAPAALRYSTSDGERCLAVAYINDLSFAESLQLIIRQKSTIAELTFAPPISALGCSRRDLALQAEAAIAAILNVPIPQAHQRFGNAGGGAEVSLTDRRQ